MAPASKSLKQLRRNIGPQPDLLGKHTVLSGAFDETGEAFLGNARAAIIGNAARDLTVAAAHQDVGDRLAKHFACGNRLQMSLTLGFREIDEIGLRQARRQFEHRPGDGNIVVIGQ